MTEEEAPRATGGTGDRRPPVALVAGGAAAIAAVVLTMIVLRPSPPSSLAVFEREPTQREREAEQRIAERDVTASYFTSSDVQARLILDLPDGSSSRAREIWALRSDESGNLEGTYIVICLATDPIGATGGQLGCMAERDVARRGFIPLDQPRPTLRVDGELRVIEWGPAGDARLIEPPEPPTFPRRTDFES